MAATLSHRYEAMFENLDAKGEGAFVPFVTIGDPNPEQSLKIIRTLVANGADALELGIPFSDPLADGPTIKVRQSAHWILAPRLTTASTYFAKCVKTTLRSLWVC